MGLLKRSIYCGRVSDQYVGQQVTVAGWVNRRRDHGGVIFIDLRDQSGIVQIVFNPEINADIMDAASELRLEYVVAARGTLVLRTQDMINPTMPTGRFEIQITELSILATSEAMPFQLDKKASKVSEDLRLTYRYLDLRRPEMQRFMQLRSDVSFAIREYFHQHGFLDVETPILSKSTPEGARDFLVPSRLSHGEFYALPQSPQMYKQLLMVAGVDRYYQLARCFRDEDLRGDRQLEFTQLDVEMAFCDEEDIYTIIEGLLSHLWKKILNIELTTPFKRFSYDEVFHTYGSDKPDMRFDLKISDCTSLFESVSLTFLQENLSRGGKVGCIRVKDHKFSRSEFDKWIEKVTKEYKGSGLIYVRFNEDRTHAGSISKFLPENFFDQAQMVIPDLTTTDTLFLIADEYDKAWSLLGKLRLELGESLGLIDHSSYEMFWVTSFPMFEWDEEQKRWFAKHHPFTAPVGDWKNQNPKDVRARAYDVVCNGYELGGGSIRINNADIQAQVFELLQLPLEKAQKQFGFLLDAQKFGYPPEGGIALGLDRLIMIFGNTHSIRDVIAFPKTQKGNCLMMGTPSEVSDEQLKELHVKIVKN